MASIAPWTPQSHTGVRRQPVRQPANCRLRVISGRRGRLTRRMDHFGVAAAAAYGLRSSLEPSARQELRAGRGADLRHGGELLPEARLQLVAVLGDEAGLGS